MKDTNFLLLSSANAIRGDGERYHDLGFSGYLGKPLNLNILYEMTGLLWQHILNGTEPAQLISRHTISEGHHVPGTDTGTSTRKDIVNCKVLLVEDNIVNQKVAKKILEKNGLQSDGCCKWSRVSCIYKSNFYLTLYLWIVRCQLWMVTKQQKPSLKAREIAIAINTR